MASTDFSTCTAMREAAGSSSESSRLAIMAVARSRSRQEYVRPSSVSTAVRSRSAGKASRSATNRFWLLMGGSGRNVQKLGGRLARKAAMPSRCSGLSA
ncbi:hypothetical protein Y695_03711 [Hydrogenophaga sp. T4]|nr:hypothetical protein Y695_03711 [Hydrogenophaga sp. T4]